MGLDMLELEAPAGLRPALSIVIPLLNEADNILLLYKRLVSAMEAAAWPWEVIFVDDGSTDATFALLQRLHAQDDHVRVLRLRRNFGQTAALAAGFDAARGAIIVSLDGDLQNDPQDIPALVHKLAEGYDVVSGWRVRRQESFWRRRLGSERNAVQQVCAARVVTVHDDPWPVVRHVRQKHVRPPGGKVNGIPPLP